MEHPVERAIKLLGSATRLAVAANVPPQFVSQWRSKRRPVPAKRALLIEAATNGEVSRHELRPDVFGRTPAEAAQ